jgi:hypothetical protein
MLNENVAVTLRVDNHHAHDWDAFPDNSLEYEAFADNNVEYQNGNSTTALKDFFSDSSLDSSASSSSGLSVVRDPKGDDLNASFSGFLAPFLNKTSREKNTELQVGQTPGFHYN